MPPASGRTRRPTLDTVARHLGVSRATVSNAYNRPDQLSAALRERVLAAAAELGYAGPDPAARGLRVRRAGAIGVLLRERLSYAFSDPAGVLFLDGLAAAVEGERYALLLLPGVAGGGPVPEAVSAAVADGMVAYSCAEGEPALEAARRRGQPLVVVDEPRGVGDATIGVDDVQGAAAVATHLAQLGHRRFGVISFELRPDRRSGWVDPRRRAEAAFSVTRDRLDGYAAAFSAAGIDPAAVPIFECAHNAQQDGWAAAAALLSLDPRPTALLAMSDELALGALSAAADAGRSVPGDVSVAGFDDTPSAARGVPPLTTVRQPLRAKGEHAGAALLALLSGGEPPDATRLPTELVVRESTGPPP